MHQPTYPDLRGKVAVVTGGSRGIGAQTSRSLAAQGVKVAVIGRDEDALSKTVASILQDGGEALGVVADVTDFAALERARTETERVLGPADFVIPFAGGGLALPGPTQDLSEAAWRSSLDGNLTATFLSVKCFLPGLTERKTGVIVTMASSAARQMTAQAPIPYSAAKAGIITFTRQLASEVAPHGVRVNCVAPAAILTERTAQHISAEQRGLMLSQYPLGRLGKPEDVALATLFLVSESASWITGVTLDVAGGKVMV